MVKAAAGKAATRRRLDNWYWTLVNAPAYLLLMVVVVVPLFYALYISFFSWELTRPPMRFAGLRGYRQLIADPVFREAFRHTIFFTVMTVVCTLVVGMVFSLMMNRRFKGRGVFRALLFIPWAIAPIVVGLLWSWIYHGQFGILNYIMLKLGLIKHYVSILGSERYAMYAVIVTFIWQNTPFTTLIVLAGLQSIPGECYEAARVDGAGAVQQFLHITVPLLRNTLLLAITFLTMWAFRTFDIIYAMTFGGPGNATTVLGWYAYRVSFTHYNLGKGAAAGAVMAAVTALLAFVYVKTFYKRVEY